MAGGFLFSHALPAKSPTWILEQDLWDVLRTGSFDWWYHGEAQPFIDSLRNLRRHCVDGKIPGILHNFHLVKQDWWINFPPSTLELVERYSTCSERDFLVLEKQLLEEQRQIQTQKREKKEAHTILKKHPLQYIVCDAVGLILGVESEAAGDLVKILWKNISHSFSPNKPNAPWHHIGFSGTITKIHCILTGKIIE